MEGDLEGDKGNCGQNIIYEKCLFFFFRVCNKRDQDGRRKEQGRKEGEGKDTKGKKI